MQMTVPLQINNFRFYLAIFELFKPRIIPMVLITTMGGMWLARHDLSLFIYGKNLLGVFLLIAGANAINMYLERYEDGRMSRTKTRPLPMGKIEPYWALVTGILFSVVSILYFYFLINTLTTLLAMGSLVIYTVIYTPYKKHSPLALWVGAIPGAMPAILGWTAVTSDLNLQAVSLFAILYFWQIPHFLAITIFRKEEYTYAGFKVMPATQGEKSTLAFIIQYSFIMIPIGLLPAAFKLVSHTYFYFAFLLSLGFFVLSLCSWNSPNILVWAKRIFFASLIYLPLLYLGLLLTRL